MITVMITWWFSYFKLKIKCKEDILKNHDKKSNSD